MKRLKVVPVIVGILVDSFGSIAVALVYFAAVLGVELARGGELTEQTLAPHVPITAVFGLVLTGIGGFIAGRLAMTDEVYHGIAVGIGSVLIWLLLDWVSPSEAAWSLVETLSFIAVIPVAALGGYAAARMNRRTLGPGE